MYVWLEKVKTIMWGRKKKTSIIFLSQKVCKTYEYVGNKDTYAKQAQIRDEKIKTIVHTHGLLCHTPVTSIIFSASTYLLERP